MFALPLKADIRRTPLGRLLCAKSGNSATWAQGAQFTTVRRGLWDPQSLSSQNW